MKKKYLLKHFICMITFVVMLCMVSGCSNKNSSGDNETAEVDKNAASTVAPTVAPTEKAAPTETPVPTAEPETEPTAEPTEEPEPSGTATADNISEIYSFQEFLEGYYANDGIIPEEFTIVTGAATNTVVVSDAESFLEAIGPNKTIIIEPGYYNLSDFLEELTEDGIDNWNSTHSCVQLERVFDGIEVCIYNVPNLQIIGNGATREDTEIVVNPRYASVLNFDSCTDILLSNFKIGHTMTGECVGNVIDFSGSAEIIIDNLDIYGCGVTGLAFYYSSGNILVRNSYIHDCSIGTFDLSNLWGYMFCVDCEFNYSPFMGYFPDEDQDYLAFLYRCTMGSGESAEKYYAEPYFTDVDCNWSEPAYYPEYDDCSDYSEATDASEFFNLTHAVTTVDEEVFLNTYWFGEVIYFPGTDTSSYLPYWENDSDGLMAYNIGFSTDGTGVLYKGYEEFLHFTWELNSDSSVLLRTDDDLYTCTAYEVGDDEDQMVWICLTLDDQAVWFSYPTFFDVDVDGE